MVRGPGRGLHQGQPRAAPGLAEQTPDDVRRYLTELGGIGRMSDWQFRQSVDAIQKLLELVGMPWLREVDWDFWRDSARALPTQRAAVGRPPERGDPAASPA